MISLTTLFHYMELFMESFFITRASKVNTGFYKIMINVWTTESRNYEETWRYWEHSSQNIWIVTFTPSDILDYHFYKGYRITHGSACYCGRCAQWKEVTDPYWHSTNHWQLNNSPVWLRDRFATLQLTEHKYTQTLKHTHRAVSSCCFSPVLPHAVFLFLAESICPKRISSKHLFLSRDT